MKLTPIIGVKSHYKIYYFILTFDRYDYFLGKNMIQKNIFAKSYFNNENTGYM